MGKYSPLGGAALLAFATSIAVAAPGAIVSALISKSGDAANIEIRFACPARLLGQSTLSARSVTEITLARLDGCPGSADAVSDATRPPGRELAAMDEIEYSARVGSDATLRLRFNRPVLVTVDQAGDLRGLRVHVETSPGSTPMVAPDEGSKRPPFAGAAPALTPEQRARAEERARQAMQPRAEKSPPPPDYVLNLRSSTKPIDLGAETAALAQHSDVVYVADIDVDEQVWHRLRLGFFATEAAADAALAVLRPRYPDAWVTRVGESERLSARADSVAGAPAQPGPVAAGQASPIVGDAQVTEALAQARAAIIDQDYSRAIQLATRLLAGPPRAESAEARELLGLARERNGEPAEAVA
ncbi:MAG: SPOR domain-containing protein, partial [Gammaproteobacteria bacterium]